MKINKFLSLLSVILAFSCSSESPSAPNNNTDTLYFPDNTTSIWEAQSASNLGWNTSELQPLLDFLQQRNSKSFMILHKGKIVVEAYFNGHNEQSLWYWASAGKTLTSTISGIAQEEGLIDINNKVSDYLGEGWTSAPLDKENLITCKNLLSMDSGLDDSLGDNVAPENLQYVADAGTRWAYHNVYVKMQDVIANASGSSWSTYFNSRLKTKIGMTGAWIQNGDFSVYWSDTRSMARFGLMIMAKGLWNGDRIISESFLHEAANTSQNINKSYGYLWWLNGKTSYHLPSLQTEFQGPLIPNAPSDMFAALGKNDQKIYVVPGKDLVIVRMGDSADGVNFALSSFDNDLWAYINAFIDT